MNSTPLTHEEAAARLGCSRSNVSRLVASGDLVAAATRCPTTGRLRVTRASVNRLAKRGLPGPGRRKKVAA